MNDDPELTEASNEPEPQKLKWYQLTLWNVIVLVNLGGLAMWGLYAGGWGNLKWTAISAAIGAVGGVVTGLYVWVREPEGTGFVTMIGFCVFVGALGGLVVGIALGALGHWQW